MVFMRSDSMKWFLLSSGVAVCITLMTPPWAEADNHTSEEEDLPTFTCTERGGQSSVIANVSLYKEDLHLILHIEHGEEKKYYVNIAQEENVQFIPILLYTQENGHHDIQIGRIEDVNLLEKQFSLLEEYIAYRCN